jgi:hypothetical protein
VDKSHSTWFCHSDMMRSSLKSSNFIRRLFVGTPHHLLEGSVEYKESFGLAKA